MALDLKDLKPYTSLTLCRAASRKHVHTLASEVIHDIETLLKETKPFVKQSMIVRFGPINKEKLSLSFIHYEESRTPGWTNSAHLKDLINHLVFVCIQSHYAALLITDPCLKRAVGRKLGTGDRGLPGLNIIKTSTLKAAFADGPTRTLWLSGIHAKTSVKADSKVLTGSDLRDALDPLGDQTYYFTAARCITDFGKHKTPVGLAPLHSRVWTGSSRSWTDFYNSVKDILTRLDHIEKMRRSEETPIPWLASPVTSCDDVQNAYDLNIVAPEASAEEQDQEDRNKHERWAYQAKFDVRSSKGPDLVAAVYLGSINLGKLEVRVDTSDPKRIKCLIKSRPESGKKLLLEEAASFCRDRRWLQIRYESGHTLSEGMFYISRFRDIQFDNWVFTDFSKYDIRKEKPFKILQGREVFSPEYIGRRDSLFCWVQRNWPLPRAAKRQCGWLACDDGSMELADFIHLDESENPPILSLIHVKGSHASSVARSISVSDYEVVVAQAIKNLRYTDRIILEEGLEHGMNKRIGNLVWHNGKSQADRSGMLRALRKVGKNPKPRVVIVQPRISLSELNAARADKKANKKSGLAARLLQLETLLVGAQVSCRNMGAELQVIADGTNQLTPEQASSFQSSDSPRRADRSWR